MTSKPILYSYYRSSCSWRVRVALALKGVDYDYKPINLVSKEGGQQLSPEFRKLNPLLQVPALVVNENQILIESMAIIEYIDEVYNCGIPLLPKDPVLRAKARAISQTIVSGIQPLQNLSTLKKVKEIQNKDSESGNLIKGNNSWAQYWITTKFDGLNKLLAKTSGKCCVGDTPTIADLCLVPQVFNAIKFGVDVNQFSDITRINAYLLTLDAFKKSHPFEQIDCPQEDNN